MHDAVTQWCERFAPNLRPLCILDIGGRDINGSTQHLFHPDSCWEVVDMFEGPRVTWVGNFLDYGTVDKFDVAVCTEVAEHTPEWPEIIAHAASLLDPMEGVFLFTAAGPGRPEHSAIDGAWGLQDGEHYENVDPDELATVLNRHFSRFVVDHTGHDVRAVAWK